MREAERTAVAFQKEAVGRLPVSSTPDLGPDHLIPAIAQFLQMNPGDLSLDTVNLVDEKFDPAIRGTISLEPNVVTRQIGGSPILVCASRIYIERHGMPQHPDEMPNMPACISQNCDAVESGISSEAISRCASLSCRG